MARGDYVYQINGVDIGGFNGASNYEGIEGIGGMVMEEVFDRKGDAKVGDVITVYRSTRSKNARPRVVRLKIVELRR